MPIGLRRQTLALATVILGATAGVAYMLASTGVSADQRAREAIEAQAQASRVVSRLNQSGDDLQRSMRDYAHWDSSYQFFIGENSNYLHADLTADSFANLDVDAILLLSPSGGPIWASLRPPSDSVPQEVGLPLNPVLNELAQGISAGGHRPAEKCVVLWVAGEAWQVAYAQVLRTGGDGPSVGTFAVARHLGANRLAPLIPYSGGTLTMAREPVEKVSSEQIVRTSANMPNPHGNAPVEVVLERLPLQLDPSMSAERWLAWTLVATALIGVAAVLFVVDAIILKRLAEFSSTAGRIRRERAHDLRLPVSGADELDELAAGINGLLDQVAATTAQLRHDAFHDPLTGLGNRALLADRLDLELIHGLRRGEQRFALSFIDLDRLKPINDLLGHEAGDQLIATVAERLRASVRGGDTVARLGGDEFAVILHDVNDSQLALALVARLLEAIRQPVHVAGRQIEVTASIGVAMPSLDSTRDTLLKQADTAMYAAKSEGGNRMALFDEGFHGREVGRGALEQDLRSALGNGLIKLVFQPIVELSSGRVVAVEALARWTHPERGVVSPEQFVGVAEESDLIVALDRFVLGEALATLSRIRAFDPHMRVAVNQSPRQLSTPDFVESIEHALEEAGVSGSALTLELTETMLARSESRWSGAMVALTAKGVRFALDDFGMGYSSLNRLQHLPVSELKLDRVFVAGLATGQEPISRAIVGLANELRRVVIAEGVEHPWQVTRLKKMGCVFAQGYLYARPMPETDLFTYLSANRASGQKPG